MSALSFKRCPKCSGDAKSSGGLSGHEAHHASDMAHHNFQHGNPALGVLVIGAAMVKALLPKKYTCSRCRHEFR
jgi:hypothetical protein